MISRVREREEWMQTWNKWKQSGPLAEHDALRGLVRRSRLIKHGMMAFDVPVEELGKANELDDIEYI